MNFTRKKSINTSRKARPIPPTQPVTAKSMTVSVNGNPIGTLSNVKWTKMPVTETVCTCGSKAGKNKSGHKSDCPWWVFSEQYGIQKRTDLKVTQSYVLGIWKTPIFESDD